MKRVVGIFLVAALLVVAIRAQQSPSGPPVFRAGVDVVRLDVSVLDKNRKPVTGLTAADFTVFEDGKMRPIVSFTPVDLPEAAPARPNTAAWTREVAPDVTTNAVAPEGRLVVIMFDWSIRAMDLPLARRIAQAAIDDLGPNDQAAIVFSNPMANAAAKAAKQDFTADRARLIAAINRPLTTALMDSGGTDVRDGNGVMLEDPEGYEGGDCLCRLCVMDTVTSMANTLRDVPGRRKLLLFIGDFFQGYELATPAPGGVPTPPGRSPFVAYFNGMPGATTPTASGVYEGQCSGQLNESLDNMKRAAGLANLTIDTFDPSGLDSPDSDPMGGITKYMEKRRDDLHIMPDATGGRTVLDINDPESQVPEALGESRSYYLVGFERASAANDGQLHSLNVKVSRPDVTVRTRTGYYATDALAESESSALAPIARALDRVLPENGLPLVAAVAAFAPPTRAALANVAVIVGIHDPAPPATASAGASPTPHQVVVALFDTNGQSVGKAEQTVTATLGGPSKTGTSFEVLSIVPAAPGHYEVRAAVDGGGDRRGSVYTFVDVPDFAKEPLSMSGILIHTTPALSVSVPDEIKVALPVVPTARRTFGAAEHVTASLRLYQRANATPVSVVLTGRIVNAQDQSVFNTSAMIDAGRFLTARAADYTVTLPIGGLAAGDYLLTIEATAGTHTDRREVRFTRSGTTAN